MQSDGKWLRRAGRILGLTVAIFWLWWGVGSAFYGGFSWVSLLAHSTPGLLILIGTLVAWKWERFGGGLLIALAVMAAGFLFWAVSLHGGDLGMAAMTWLILGLPPGVAGILILASWRQERRLLT